MLMGTAEGKQLDKIEKKMFDEDLSAAQKAQIYKEKTGEALPVGLVNLGNTCYMNSTLQCLKKVKELSAEVRNYSGSTISHDKKTGLAAAYRDLTVQLEQKGTSFPPFQFVQVSISHSLILSFNSSV